MRQLRLSVGSSEAFSIPTLKQSERSETVSVGSWPVKLTSFELGFAFLVSELINLIDHFRLIWWGYV